MRTRLVLGGALLCLSTATYGQDTGFFIGGSVGQSNYDLGFSSGDFFGGPNPGTVRVTTDEEDTSYSLMAGYNINEYLSLDAAVIDFGSASISFVDVTDSARVTISADGYSFGITSSLPIGDTFKVFARGGALYWEAESKAVVSGQGTLFRVSEDDYDGYYGFGGAYILGETELFLDYTFYTLWNADVDVISLGLKFNF